MRRTVRFALFIGILLIVAVAAHAQPFNGPITDPIPRLIALL